MLPEKAITPIYEIMEHVVVSTFFTRDEDDLFDEEVQKLAVSRILLKNFSITS